MIGLVIRRFLRSPQGLRFSVQRAFATRSSCRDPARLDRLWRASFFFTLAAGSCSRQPNWPRGRRPFPSGELSSGRIFFRHESWRRRGSESFFLVGSPGFDSHLHPIFPAFQAYPSLHGADQFGVEKRTNPECYSPWTSKTRKSSAPPNGGVCLARLLDAYSCIMCNRCQDVCPATNTGKALSPAAILINERYELNKIFPEFLCGQESPRPLLDFALNEEAAWACTTCNACIEVCPVGNEQMLHIIDVRRERVLAAAEFPNGLKNSFNHMERAGNPWGISADERLVWAKDCLSRCRRSSKIPIRMCSIGLVARWRLIPGAEDRPQFGRDSQFRRSKLGGAGQRGKVHRRPGAAHRQRVSLRPNGRQKTSRL